MLCRVFSIVVVMVNMLGLLDDISIIVLFVVVSLKVCWVCCNFLWLLLLCSICLVWKGLVMLM